MSQFRRLSQEKDRLRELVEERSYRTPGTPEYARLDAAVRAQEQRVLEADEEYVACTNAAPPE